MRCHGRLLAVAVLTVLCACSGDSSSTPTTMIPQPNSPINAPSGNVQSVQLGLQPTSATLPVVAQITGTLLFPAVRTPATISLSGSAMAPAGIALENLRRAQSGTLTVYEYVTIVSPITISLPSIPAMTLHFPASTPLAGKSVYYGISDLDAQGGLVSFNTQGPGTIDGQTVSFAPVPTPITYEAGHKYTSVVYATGTAGKVGATKIYVTNAGGSYPSTYPNFTAFATTYNADGTQTAPVFTAGLDYPAGVAVDAAGKIYVANSNNNTVTTYKADGTQTTPTITEGLNSPAGVAVDAAGKIYVANSRSHYRPNGSFFDVTTYNADGSRSTPTITAGVFAPEAIAVDAAGKIYVRNQSDPAGGVVTDTVTTYKPDGTQTTPTITAGLKGGQGIAVDAAGKIYLTNPVYNNVTTYKPDGTPTTPTISAGADQPVGVAVDAAGKIYVANLGNYTVTTYNADGTPTTPTITAALNAPVGIAVH